jgi:outer membrane murein-binding lipoprotein Lpp
MAINIPIVSEFNNAGLKKAQREFNKLEKTSQKVGFALKKAFVPATAALGGLAVAGAKMVAAGEQAATANARIEQIATSMGLFGEQTQVVTNRLVDLANEQARLTGVNQNAIKESQALLLTFKDIASSADEVGGAFDRATQLTLDMASAGFGSVTDNAKQLGKALNDPIAGLTALRRSGIQFTEAQQDQIRTLVESGEVLEAQNLILEEIENQVGGTAEATANGTDKMKVAFSQASESIGLALLPVMEKLVEIIVPLADFIAENTELILALAAGIGTLAGAVVVANVAMKLWSAITAITTGVNYALATSFTAVQVASGLIVFTALIAALVYLEQKFGIVSAAIEKLLGFFNLLRDGVGWLAEKLGLASDEIENFERTTDNARKEAGDMYESVRDMGDSVGDAREQFERAIRPTEDYQQKIDRASGSTEKLTERVDELWSSTDELYKRMFALNPEIQRYLDQLDREQAVRDFNSAVDEFRGIADSNAEGSDEWQEANKRVYEELANVIEEMGNVPQEVQSELKILVDTGQLDTAIAKANALADALRLARVEAPAGGGGGIPGFADLQASLQGSGFVGTTVPTAAGLQSSTLIRPGQGNVTYNVNVATLNPTAETGRVIVDSIRRFNRASGPAGIQTNARL